MKTEVRQQLFTGERALFHASDLRVSECVFEKGESPLKEGRGLEIDTTLFRYKYPLWYCQGVKMQNCTLFDMARSGIWYTKDIEIEHTVIEAPKTFRRSSGITLRDVSLPNAAETLWNCDDIRLEQVQAKGDYFGFGSNHIEADGLVLTGNYCFDGSRDMVIRNSKLISKDALWNTENVTVYDSFIVGEYLGWNSRNLTFINCTIESLQGMCYIDNLVMKNCKLMNTTLAFEYAKADVEVTGRINSVLNPAEGRIKADRIDTLIVQKKEVDPDKTTIACENIGKQTDEIDWQEVLS